MKPDLAAEVVIPLSRNKLALLLVGSVAFVGGGILLCFLADTQTDFHPAFMKGVGLVGVFFFGLCSIYGCVKMFDPRPGLIIDEDGIVDRSNAVSAGRLHWDEITGLKVSTIMGQRFLVIELADPRKCLERWGFFKRMMNAVNMKITGSPVNIASNSLRIDFDELVQVLTAALRRYKGVGQITR